MLQLLHGVIYKHTDMDGLHSLNRSSCLTLIEVTIAIGAFLVGFATSIVITAGLTQTCEAIHDETKS